MCAVPAGNDLKPGTTQGLPGPGGTAGASFIPEKEFIMINYL
jgi:hypothetical protein